MKVTQEDLIKTWDEIKNHFEVIQIFGVVNLDVN